jgi:predicted nucleic-acid-binding Zn-ribbon protein
MSIKDGTCPKCNSPRVVPNLPVHPEITRVVYCNIAEPADKTRFIQKVSSVRSELRAWICGACGYTEIYASQHAELAAGYEKGWRDGTA